MIRAHARADQLHYQDSEDAAAFLAADFPAADFLAAGFFRAAVARLRLATGAEPLPPGFALKVSSVFGSAAVAAVPLAARGDFFAAFRLRAGRAELAGRESTPSGLDSPSASAASVRSSSTLLAASSAGAGVRSKSSDA